MSNTLYIVDTFSLIFQVFHAVAEMTGPQGQPTNAVFGFTRDLMNLRRNPRLSHLICALDSSGPGARKDIYAEYKANRSETPVDLLPQIPMVIDVIEGFGVPAISHEKWEADDVIATLTRQAVEQGFDVCIVTSDKDIRQLLGPHVTMYNVRKDTIFDEAALREAWGIRADQVVDFQSLTGDSVDNVPGVPLVGPKKASTLLEKFGTLDEVLAHADEAPGPKLRENLKTFADQARLSRELVRLNDRLPIEFNAEQAKITDPNRDRLLELFTEHGFRRFADEMREPAADSKPAKVERTWETIDTPESFSRFLDELKKQSKFCVDLETTGLNAVRADIVGWAFSWKPGSGYYLPVDAPPGQPALDPKTVLDAVGPLLEDPDIEIVNQNIKYDMLVLRRAGVTLCGIGVDPMVGDYLLDAGARSHGLTALAERYLAHNMIPISNLIGSGKKQKKMFEVDVTDASEYASEDADIAFQLAEVIAADLKRENLWDLYWDLERPLIPVLVEMEYTGIRVDVEELQRQSDELTERLDELVVEIYGMAGREFNIGSPKQVAEVLFNELKLPVIKRTKTGPSTSQDVLEKLADLHPLPALMTEHRHLSKLKGTYLDALPELVNPETGRIHASFNQVVAATGRLSASSPNLQNIPIRTEEGRRVRKAFTAGHEGWKLLCADYSQIELRMLAHFSHDEAMLTAFREGADIHTAVAAEIFNVGLDDVDSQQRRVAKAVNFGVIYGQSPYGLSEALGIGQDEAAEFIDNYFLRYAGVDRYLKEVLRECAESGYARTILGRRRKISGVRPDAGMQRNLAERTAINTVVQGSAADLIKRAMINLHERLVCEQHPANMLLQIHDELIFESPAADLPSLIEMVRTEMTTALELDVPLEIDLSVGDNWLESETI
ncbi:MAG: DNA polymerase I [Planctomycetaceae bacterium]|jgi:DNA polymerase I|nr:DNA polymerase I [Planctomycetaceae bacterium]MBT6493858.1 DNA polymerase I [Planctomycetaceae bacterium]